MAALAPALPFVSAALGVVSAIGTIASGNAQNKAYGYQAAQAEQAAGQERATAQRAAIEERRAAKFALSKGQAVAAASGTDPLSVSTVDIQEDLAAQGEYNAMSQLFAGEERARGLEGQAGAYRTQGKIAKQAAVITGMSTLATTGSSLYNKYGFDQPGMPTADALKYG